MPQKNDYLKANSNGATKQKKAKSTEPKLQTILRELPQVDEILNTQAIQCLKHALPHDFLKSAVRDVLNEIRDDVVRAKEEEITLPDNETIAQRSGARALLLMKPSLRSVVNASGVIIHTNLGRSSLCNEAVQAVVDVAKGYSTLEYSIDKMERGSRHDHVEQLLCTLTGAQAAICVNNNAAAVMMVLNEFASQHEAIVSRGELVEIGGSFRVPDIMNLSNAKMVEVGTTNKTHVSDYEDNITGDTAMLLKVHPSNYRMDGFVEDVSIKELQKIATAENKRRKDSGSSNTKVIVYEDQGSGVLLNHPFFKNNGEHTVTDSLNLGVDLVSCSGDKLLGGPQAGIILGNKSYIERLKKNPLARALRLDKMTLAALEATLRVYLNEEEALSKIPTLRMLTESALDVKVRADELCKQLTSAIGSKKATFEVVSEISRAGGGSLPMCDIETYCIRAKFAKVDAFEVDKYLIQECEPPIIPRLTQDTILLDARTLNESDFDTIVNAMSSFFKTTK